MGGMSTNYCFGSKTNSLRWTTNNSDPHAVKTLILSVIHVRRRRILWELLKPLYIQWQGAHFLVMPLNVIVSIRPLASIVQPC